MPGRGLTARSAFPILKAHTLHDTFRPLLRAKDTLQFQPLGPHRGQQRLRFSAERSPYAGAKGLWVTPEFYHPSFPDVYKKGGLGQVSGVIPWQLHDRGYDVRPVFPMLKGMEALGFEPTGLPPAVIKSPSGEAESYELWWKKVDGVVCYAIKNEGFAKRDNLYYSETLPEEGEDAAAEKKNALRDENTGQQLVSSGSGGYRVLSSNHSGSGPVNRGVFKFNQAVAAFAPLLDDRSSKTGSAPDPVIGARQPWQLPGGADVNFFHDWFSGAILSELKEKEPDYFRRTGSVFYVHNTYDHANGQKQLWLAEKLGIAIPEEIRRENQRDVQIVVKLPQAPGEAMEGGDANDAGGGGNWFSFWLRGINPFARLEKTVEGLPPRVTQNGDTAKAGGETQTIQQTNPEAWAFSPLAWGMRLADTLVMNQRFKETNLKTSFQQGAMGDPMFVNYLRQKDRAGAVVDMHHAIGPQYTPYASVHLQSDGFRPLTADVSPRPGAVWMNRLRGWANLGLFFLPKAKRLPVYTPDELAHQANVQEFKAYKSANRQALQKAYGLREDPQATMYLWLARPDLRQKGALMMMESLTKFLHEHPHAQAVLGGGFPENDPKNPLVSSFVQQWKKDPVLKGRLHIFPKFVDQKTSIRLLAGTDCLFHPSTYEPYGLSQLEAMAFGAVPIVSPRDGLYATVHDPHVLPTYLAHAEADRNRNAYGQTGFHLDMDDDGMRYVHALDRQALPSEPAIRQADKLFLQALDRTYRVAQRGVLPEIALNGMQYVQNEHNRSVIAERYDAVFEKALQARDARLKQETTASPSEMK
jgi:glycogen synthase